MKDVRYRQPNRQQQSDSSLDVVEEEHGKHHAADHSMHLMQGVLHTD